MSHLNMCDYIFDYDWDSDDMIRLKKNTNDQKPRHTSNKDGAVQNERQPGNTATIRPKPFRDREQARTLRKAAVAVGVFGIPKLVLPSVYHRALLTPPSMSSLATSQLLHQSQTESMVHHQSAMTNELNKFTSNNSFNTNNNYHGDLDVTNNNVKSMISSNNSYNDSFPPSSPNNMTRSLTIVGNRNQEQSRNARGSVSYIRSATANECIDNVDSFCYDRHIYAQESEISAYIENDQFKQKSFRRTRTAALMELVKQK